MFHRACHVDSQLITAKWVLLVKSIGEPCVRNFAVLQKRLTVAEVVKVPGHFRIDRFSSPPPSFGEKDNWIRISRKSRAYQCKQKSTFD